MESGHLLTRSGLTYPEVSSKVYHDSFCQLGSSAGLNLEKMYNIKMFYDNDREEDVVWTNLAQVMNHNDNQISTSIRTDTFLAS